MVSKRIQNSKSLSGFIILVVAFEVLSLIWINLFPKEIFMDEDYAKIVRHIIEIGDRKQLFLPNFDYITTAEFDCAGTIAVLFYIITGNVHLAFGIANVCNILIWGFVLFWLLDEAKSGLDYKLMAFALVLVPYDYGMLSYTNMMFFCGGQYIYKTLVPILFVLALAVPASEWRKGKNIIVYVLLFFLAFLTALSEGLYVMICGVFPVIICLFFMWISGKDKGNILYRVIVAGLTVTFSLIGIMVCKLAEIDPYSKGMNMRSTVDYVGVANEIINYFIRLFNPFFKSGVFATSFDGVVVCMRWILIGFFLMGLAFIPKAFGLFMSKKSNGEALDSRTFVSTACISIFVWNIFIMCMTTSSPRYHLIGAIPLMIVAVLFLEDFLKTHDEKLGVFVQMLLGICIIMITFSSIYRESDEYFNGANVYYKLSKDQKNQLISFLDENDIGTVFFVDDYELPEMLRAFDKTRVYETYVSVDGTVMNHDFYITDRDRASYSDKNLIFVKENMIETLPEYIIENYTRLERFGGFELFVSEHNPIDGISYVAKDTRTIDLPTTPGYGYSGEIDGNGWLHATDEGEVLKSALIESNNPFTLTVYYSLEVGAGATLKQYEYFDSETIVERNTYELSPELDSIKINIEFPSRYIFSIEKEDSGEMVIKELIFD